MSGPKITVGITCYNAQDSIARAIRSALEQEWEDKEILVVDDFSSDSSVSVVEALRKDHPEITLLRHDMNKGVAAARNTILKAARGEYLAFFDDDDESFPRRLDIQYRRILETEKALGHKNIFCFAGVRRHYPNGYAPVFEAIGSRTKIPAGDDIVRYHLYLDRDPEVFYGSGTPCLSFMARVDALRALGGFDEALRRNEDGELAIRLGFAGGTAIGCPEILIEQTASGGIDKRPEVSFESDLYIIEKYKKVLELHGRYAYARLWARLKYLHHAGKKFEALGILALMISRFPLLTVRRFLARAPARLAHERRFSAEKKS